ncbi:hypothetical protein QN277_017099 [Acacia crassicarpa]|uniref:Sororin C-terminal region domain-containing protein n=1 Tax=Acacia crassicarpa TaxID=499986 RepID=A0AAE1JRR2_9FABA|nr:hypothetical protein QN277_017099 [Acacia crassicarpa]
MEASRRLLKRRKPLSNITNTDSHAFPSSHSSSSTASATVAHPSKPGPPSSFNNLALTQRKSDSRTRSSANSTSRRVASSNPSHLSPAASSPPRLLNSSLLPGSHDDDISEPISVVYSRRRISEQRKGKEKEVVVPFSITPMPKVSSSSRRRTSEQMKGKEKEVAVPFSITPMPKVSSSREQNLEVEGLNRRKAKALTAPCRKKRCTVASKQDEFQHAMPQDFIEKQQAYFKEIDNFELPVEEVQSVDELD